MRAATSSAKSGRFHSTNAPRTSARGGSGGSALGANRSRSTPGWRIVASFAISSAIAFEVAAAPFALRVAAFTTARTGPRGSRS